MSPPDSTAENVSPELEMPPTGSDKAGEGRGKEEGEKLKQVLLFDFWPDLIGDFCIFL
jgi:hypothetical protein